MSENSNYIVTPNGIVNDVKYEGKCSCGGTKNLKYKKGDYLIYSLPKRKTFHVKQGNNYIQKNQPIETLCEVLTSLGFPACAAHSSTN